MSFVLDSSVTLAWIYHDEWTPDVLRVSEMASCQCCNTNRR